MPGVNGIDVLAARFTYQLVNQSFGYAVDAAHGGYYPYLITHANITVLAAIALEGTILDGNTKFLVYRLVGIIQCAAKVGLQVVFVYPVSSLHSLKCMSDGVTVFDDVFACCHVFDEHLMASRCVLVKCNTQTINFNQIPLLLRLQTYNDAVCFVYFQVSSLFHFLFVVFV